MNVLGIPLWTCARPLVGAICLATGSSALAIDIPEGDLRAALDAYAAQTGLQIVYRPDDLKGLRSRPVSGPLQAEQALTRLLGDAPLQVLPDGAGAVAVIRVVADTVSSPGLDSGADQASASALPRVVVTAQKRREPAQEVPIALSTFSADVIEDFRLRNLDDVARLTPGLLVSRFSANSPTIAVRGANNTFSQIGVSKPVSVVVDDVFVTRNSAAAFELYDLESITVLKGPQGTLFGRNVTGGAVVIETRKPSFGRREVEAELTAGNFDLRQLSALYNEPVSADSALKLSTTVLKRGGFGSDRLTGREQDDLDSANLRAQWRLRPASGWNVLLAADFARDRSAGRTLSSTTLGDDGNRRTSELGVEQGFERDLWGVSLKADGRVGGGQITSITALRHSDSLENYSGVGANFRFLNPPSNQNVIRDADDVDTLSQELRYLSPRWQAGDFIAGLYLLNERGKRLLNTRGLAAGSGALASSILSDARVETTSYALFADGSLRLAEDLRFIAGLRYTYDTRKAGLTRTNQLSGSGSFTVPGVRASWRELTPRVALQWRPSSDLLTYVGATEGFSAGGFNTDASNAAAFSTPYDPETITNYEAGVKSEWLNRSLRANLAVFRMKYKDKHELVVNPAVGVFTIVNASSATIDGAELELQWRPVRAFGVALAYGYLDSVYDRFVAGTVNNTGNPLASSPRHSAALSADVRVPWRAGRLVGTASFAWTDSYNTGAANDPNLRIPAYGLLNGSFGYESGDGRWRVSVWSKNLGNKEYLYTRSIQVVRAEYLGAPRTYGLSAAFKL